MRTPTSDRGMIAAQLTDAELLHLFQTWILQAHDAGDEARLARLLPIRNRIQADLDAADDAEREAAAA